MTAEKTNLAILLSALSICVLVLIDAYCIPVRPHYDSVVNKPYYEQRTRRSTITTCELVTHHFDIDVTGSFYNHLAVGDSIIIYSSALTGSVQKAEAIKDSGSRMFIIGYTKARWGIFYNLLTIILLVFAITSNKKNTQYGNKKTLPYFLLGFSLLIAGFHLGLDHFFF